MAATAANRKYCEKWYRATGTSPRVQKQRTARMAPPRTLEEARFILGLTEKPPEEPVRNGKPVFLLPRELARYIREGG